MAAEIIKVTSIMRRAILFSLLFLSIILFFGFEVVLAMIEISAKPNPWFVLFVGLLVFAWRIFSDSRKWRYEKSAFRLTSALEAIEEGHKLLADGNNDRVTWISAARALKRGRHMMDGLTEDVHKDVLEVQLDRYRIKFGEILGCDDKKKDEAFFRGCPPTEHLKKPLNEPLNIPPSTIKIIWDFAQYPAEYEDPIPFGDTFSDAEIDRGVNSVRYPGLIEYLKMVRKNITRSIP